jgi:hypothetical protein
MAVAIIDHRRQRIAFGMKNFFDSQFKLGDIVGLGVGGQDIPTRQGRAHAREVAPVNIASANGPVALHMDDLHFSFGLQGDFQRMAEGNQAGARKIQRMDDP